MTSREFYLERFQVESEVTLRVLSALPKDRLEYRPDSRSPSAHHLAWTLTYELKSCLDVLNEGKSDWKVISPPPLAEMLKTYEQNAKNLAERVARADDATWDWSAQFFYEGQLVTEHPVRQFLWLSLFDSIHHRGQLAAYLRPMGGKVPAIYGPSADDPQGMGAWR